MSKFVKVLLLITSLGALAWVYWKKVNRDNAAAWAAGTDDLH